MHFAAEESRAGSQSLRPRAHVSLMRVLSSRFECNNVGSSSSSCSAGPRIGLTQASGSPGGPIAYLVGQPTRLDPGFPTALQEEPINMAEHSLDSHGDPLGDCAALWRTTTQGRQRHLPGVTFC